ncbi:MAG: DHH family phosphoesterase [Candidatus Nezhaarchaeota archaeon]|nr:DHH family phosphoesterase [Candidatus Nezhaarchaeota archaeon]MCX8141937.1 DHH family phosphoesterase [Candidatus Nezhaarchaeota archaeon]MDW8050282.1 DHH family phosphoesterase [Nitrososphaerota archaeon]
MVRLIKQVKHIVITSHQNSDVDAVLSCCITKKLINSINPHVVVDVIVPRINVTAKKVLERLGLSNVIEEGDRFPEYDTCFFIDVNNPSHLGPLQKEVRIDKPVVIIDHHKPSSAIPPNTLISIIDEQAIATAEVLCDLMCELGIKPNKKEALCLLIGILYDSRKLSIGGLKTFHKVSFLLSCGASLAEASSILYMPLSYSEKIARLKASQRACLLSIGQWVVALSNVGSYEASAARALIDLGADIAAVCNEFEGGSRMCVRASEEFVRLTGIHLGKELEDLGLAMSGSGGGHASAACMSTPRTCNEVLKRFLELLSDRLKLPIKKVD